MWISEISRVRGLPVRSIERISETAARASSAAAPPDRVSSGRMPVITGRRGGGGGGRGGAAPRSRGAGRVGPRPLADGDREGGRREEPLDCCRHDGGRACEEE